MNSFIKISGETTENIVPEEGGRGEGREERRRMRRIFWEGKKGGREKNLLDISDRGMKLFGPELG